MKKAAGLIIGLTIPTSLCFGEMLDDPQTLTQFAQVAV